MSLQNNPFYILKVPFNAVRREIIAASDEMSFILNSDVCSEAQNILINPQKRITAELDWFIDGSVSKIDKIRIKIDNQETIPTDGLTSLSKLNATLYNFSLSEKNNPNELVNKILDINQQFSQLDVDEITNALNACRAISKFPFVQTQNISLELSKKRDDIRMKITDKLSSINQDSYIELITILTETYIAHEDYEDGVILSDVVDQYEVRMQSVIEGRTEQIENYIEYIKKLINDDAIDNNINELIKRVQNWDKLVQPLQLKSQVSGISHKISEHLAIELRRLALYLHNKKGKTKEALTLVNAMKGVFAEFDDLSDLFESDSGALSVLIQGEKNAQEVISQMDSLQSLSENIISYATSYNVDNFVDRVKKLDEKLISLDLDIEIKRKIRETLCCIARNTAIELHNNKQQTSFAFTISKALEMEFSDIQSLRAKLIEDLTTLQQHILLSEKLDIRTPRHNSSNASSSKPRNSGCLVGIIIVVALIIIFALSSGGGSNTSKSSYSSSSSTFSSGNSTKSSVNKTSTETRYSSSSTSGEKVYTDIISIFPEIGIYTEGSSNYSSFVCRCITSSGSTVWVYMTVSEYKKFFDSKASTNIMNRYANEVKFTKLKRIHGVTKKTESIMIGLSSDTSTTLIQYYSVD